MSDTEFYFTFEERFRGSRELVRSRLELYIPFIKPFKIFDASPVALDLGCSRGEWLELLRDNGFQSTGVDFDEKMILFCRKKGLNVRQVDALAFLEGLAAESQQVVSAFHVVEHMDFQKLQRLITESFRVLMPGGLLILETPNPENLSVGTSGFYMDPTHQRPLPAQLLSFLVKYSGFGRVKTLYLNESPSLGESGKMTLLSVLDGVSPDYSIVAQKKDTVATMELFNAPFERSYGVRLQALAERYDQHAESRVVQVQNQVQWLQSEWNAATQRIEDLSQKSGKLEAERDFERQRTAQLQSEWNTATQRIEDLSQQSGELEAERDFERQRAAQLQSELDMARATIDEFGQSSHQWRMVAEGLERQLKSVYSSYSWRIMARLRAIWHWGARLLGRSFTLLRRCLGVMDRTGRACLLKAMAKVLKEPVLTKLTMKVLRKYPTLRMRLRDLALRGGLITVGGEPIATFSSHRPEIALAAETHLATSTVAAGNLSPRAARIYSKLAGAEPMGA